MEEVKTILEKYPDKRNSTGFLNIFKKDDRGIPQPTGPHIVKVLGSEMTTRDTERLQGEDGLEIKVEEDGQELKYFVPMLKKDSNGQPIKTEFNYLFEAFENIEIGDTITMEGKNKGKKKFIEVQKVEEEEEDEIPVIEDENS